MNSMSAFYPGNNSMLINSVSSNKRVCTESQHVRLQAAPEMRAQPRPGPHQHPSVSVSDTNNNSMLIHSDPSIKSVCTNLQHVHLQAAPEMRAQPRSGPHQHARGGPQGYARPATPENVMPPHAVHARP